MSDWVGHEIGADHTRKPGSFSPWTIAVASRSLDSMLGLCQAVPEDAGVSVAPNVDPSWVEG